MTTLLVAVIAIVVGEIAGLAVNGLARALLDATLVLVLLLQAGRSRGGAVDRLLLVLTLLPLTRLLGLVLAGLRWPLTFSTMAVGVPVLVAAALTLRQLRLPAEAVSLRLREPNLQLIIALSGLPLGMAGFALLRPAAVYPPNLLSAATLVVFSGLLEELVFRALLQSQAVAVLGRSLGLGLTAGLFATLYLGTLQPMYAAFMGAAGLFFGYCVYKTDSIWGAVLAHGLLKLVLLLLLPMLMVAR